MLCYRKWVVCDKNREVIVNFRIMVKEGKLYYMYLGSPTGYSNDAVSKDFLSAIP